MNLFRRTRDVRHLFISQFAFSPHILSFSFARKNSWSLINLDCK